MFKKTQIRAIMNLLQQGRSYREIARTLSVSKNTVISIEKVLQSDSHEIEEILSFSDEELYNLFYPGKRILLVFLFFIFFPSGLILLQNISIYYGNLY